MERDVEMRATELGVEQASVSRSDNHALSGDGRPSGYYEGGSDGALGPSRILALPDQTGAAITDRPEELAIASLQSGVNVNDHDASNGLIQEDNLGSDMDQDHDNNLNEVGPIVIL